MCFSFFKMFSLSLIFCSLNMICLGVSFLTCTCFVFSGLLGFVLWCLSLLLENSQPLLFHSLILFPFFHLLLSFLLHTCYTFCNFPTVLEYSIEFDHIFSLGHFSWHTLFIYLFIYGRARSLLLHAVFSSCDKQGAILCCSTRASHCCGFYRCKAWALGHMGFSSCGIWAQ